MTGKVLCDGAGRIPRRGLIALAALGALGALGTSAAAAAKVPPPQPRYFNLGVRWIGAAGTCVAPPDWTAERVFSIPKLPPALAELCLYSWRSSTPPTPSQVQLLFTVSRARELTEDVPVVIPSAPLSTEQTAFFGGLRRALRTQVGGAALLPAQPARPGVRVVVIDSAPDAVAGDIGPGLSRHGDTLAHLIEDLVCVTDAAGRRRCAAEVTTALALPWIETGKLGAKGGQVGTLSDLARAVARAVARWQADRHDAPGTTPERLLLNLSVGWEDSPGIADCNVGAPASMGPPARAVLGILQYAATQGALLIAAAGNDSGGPTPRSGLVCPGRYQAVPRDSDPSQSLVVAASGVDYADRPIVSTRPLGISAISAIGLGGVAWAPADPVPPALVGTSVATAVVSAVSALVWVAEPSWSPAQVTAAVYDGGVDVGPAHACPAVRSPCRSRRASVCGALQAAGAAPTCAVAPAALAGWPHLEAELLALQATYDSVSTSSSVIHDPPLLAASIPRYQAPTKQLQPWVFPMPISATCPTCVATAASLTSPPYLAVLGLEAPLHSPMLVVELPGGQQAGLALGPSLAPLTAYKFLLPTWWDIQSAYLTGFDLDSGSVTEQLFVQQ